MFHGAASRRFTQDSPVLPDVWLRFAETLAAGRARRLDLLLTPHRDASAPALAAELRRRLHDERQSPHWLAWHDGAPDGATDLAYHQSTVVARLSFSELVRVALPLSRWWRDVTPGAADDLAAFLQIPSTRARVLDGLREVTADPELPRETRLPPPAPTPAAAKSPPISPDLLWMIKVTGTMLIASGAAGPPVPPPRDKRAFLALSRDLERVLAAFEKLVEGSRPPAAEGSLLYTVALNRRVTPTIARSVMAVKGDAARRLFDVDTRNIAWAVLDSGIDATHPAFRKKQNDGTPHANPFDPIPGSANVRNNTTVAAAFDFGTIRTLLDPDVSDSERADKAPALASGGRIPLAAAQQPARLAEASTQAPDPEVVAMRAADLSRRLQAGRAIDWEELEPLLRIPFGDYRAPEFDHGTHVAGILGGNWCRKDWPNDYPADERDDLVGICPGLTLYDFRVLGADGTGDEFTVMAALQFIRHLNANREQPAIQGANLSFSLRHDVANYACGRTPVCDECERVVASGVVVVAAAGNEGYLRFTTPGGESEGYRSISISDPGNAESVITVGATHRSAPHTYGVSYFSSRGPTGDGRVKPDLVAPGEKITAPITGNRAGTKDGTSMAAPHVSGAAVLLMARHRELLGDPVRVKQILCGTATDLGRERYFQGAGMVDVLRALQSV